MNIALLRVSTGCLTMAYHLSMSTRQLNYIAYERLRFIIVLNCPTVRLMRSFNFLFDKSILHLGF